MAAMNRAQLVLARFDCAEYRLCRGLNRAASRRWIRQLMRLASRLGDGPLWYLLLPALPLLFGAAALRPALIMAVAGLAGHLIYRRLKATLVRERPFIRHAGINLEMPPLDRYSFPSGHTMHAVCFSWQAVAHFPVLGWLLLPVAALIALSRVVLGLHYPTDVIAGAALAALVARLGLAGDVAFVGYLDRERALADCYAAAARQYARGWSAGWMAWRLREFYAEQCARAKISPGLPPAAPGEPHERQACLDSR